MDMSDANLELPGESEVVQPAEEPEPSHLLPPGLEETPSTEDAALENEAAQSCELHEMEPSLQPYADMPEVVANENTDRESVLCFLPTPPGDDIDFAPSNNSPDMPGASSVMIGRWEPRDSPPLSPRSEHSSHSSLYPPGSARTSYGGGPEPNRSLVRSREPKADLNSGDVVMLMHQGRPYVAVQARLPYKDDAWHTVLELAEEGNAPESEALSYLEVVKQGGCVGFRSGAAGNRFMQPRRKAPHRLVFFNQNCGIWEHWTALGDDWRTTPWSTLRMVFQSRRLPHVELSVDVVRVGYFTAPGLGGLPPRALLPVIPEDTQMEDRNLRRITNLLLAEWFKFVDHEKLLREGLEADLAALADETQELKLKTIQQVEYLRVHMNEEMVSLSHHVALRDDALATMRRWLRRAQQLAADRMARQRHRRILMAWRYVVDDIVFQKAAILKLRRKRENAAREAAFRAWNAHTRAVLGAAVKLKFAVQRRSHSLMCRVLKGWQLVVARRAWRGRTMLAAVQRRAVRRMAASFKSWRLLAVQRGLARRALLRALHGVNQSWLAAALMAWRAATQAMRQREVQAELLVSRRAARMQSAALDAWREQVLYGRLADRHARAARLRKTLTGWRQAATAAHSAEVTAGALAASRREALRREALLNWRAAATAARALRQRLGRQLMARVAELQGRALAAWSLAARERRRRRVVLQRHLAVLRMRTTSAALAGWRAVAARAVWRRVRVMAALGRASTRRLTAALVSWHAFAAARRATAGRAALLTSRLRRMRLVACLGAWRHVAAQLGAARTNLLALCKRLLGYTLSGSFREWRLLAATAAASRTAVARTLPSHTRELLKHVLATWWAQHCAFAAPGEDVTALPHARSAVAAVSAGGGRGSPVSSGLSASYAAAAAAAAAAASAAAATEPLGYGAAASPRHSFSHLYDAAAQATFGVAASPRVSAGVASAPSAGAPFLPSASASLQPQLTAHEISVAASEDVEPISPTRERSFAAADAELAANVWLPEPVPSAAADTPVGSPLPRGSATSVSSAPPTAARPSSQPSLPPFALGPSPPSSSMPVQRRPRGSSTSAGGSDGSSGAAQLFSELSVNFPANLAKVPYTPPLQRRSRTYREALVAGAASAAAAARNIAGAAAAAGQTRSSSTGRIRGSVTSLASSASSGHHHHHHHTSGPFLPANAAVIGAAASPVLLEMGPTRGGEGPLTPVGLPELLEGPMEISRESSATAGFGSVNSATADTSEAEAVEAKAEVEGEAEGEGEGEVVEEALPDGAAPEAVRLSAEALLEVHASLQQQAKAEVADGSEALAATPFESGTPTASRSLGFVAGFVAEEAVQHVRSGGLSVAMSVPVMPSPAAVAARAQQAVPAGGRRAALETVRSGLGRWLAAAVLMRWRRAVAAERRWVACLEGVAASRRRQLAVEVLGAWWQMAAVARAQVAEAEALAVKAVARSGRQALREALVLWHAVARRGAVVHVLLARQLARVGAATARRVLAEWHSVAAERAAVERKVERQAIRREQALLTGVLRAWRGEVAARATRCAAASELANSQARGLLACALHGWSSAAAARRERAARQARAARYATRRRLIGAFRGWRWAAEEANEREAVAVRASRAAALRTAFGGWWRMTAAATQVGTVDLGASLQRAVGWHQRRLMRSFLAALAENRERKLELHRCAVEFWSQSTGAAVLGAWRLEATWARWAAAEVARLHSRSAQRLQSRCLSAWLDRAEAAAAARAAADQLAARRQRGLLAELLAGWQAAVSESAAARARQASCACRIGRGCLQRVFLAWREAAAQRRASRQRQQVVRRRLDSQCLRRVLAEWAALAADLRGVRAEVDRRFATSSTALLSLSFAGWLDLAQRLRAARTAAATRGSVADLALLRHTLRCWSAAVERSRAVAAAADAMAARREARVLPAVLRAWAMAACEDEARRLQLAALRHLMTRRRISFARRVFDAWREAVFDRQARNDELRRCIKRKKLAFSLFKQWYWEAFDSDVQATIWRMFHSTDPAAHSPEPSSRVPPGYRQPASAALQQPIPTYLLQHQQYVNRRSVGPGASYGNSSAARPGELPPLDLDHQEASADSGAAASSYDYRPRAATAASGLLTAADRTAMHQSQLMRGGSRLASASSQPVTQSRLGAVPEGHPQEGPEAVRTLASTFDAVAQPTMSGRARAASAAVTPLLLTSGSRSTAAAAASGRRDGATAMAPRPSAYPVLRPSDSETSDEQDDIRELVAAAAAAARPAAAATVPRRRETIAATTVTAAARAAAVRASRGPDAGSAGGASARRASVAASTGAFSVASKSTVSSRAAAAANAAANANASRRSSTSSAASGSAAARRLTSGRAAAPTSPSAASTMAPLSARASGGGSAAAGAASPSLEAMSAALNVAMRSLDLAAEVAHANAANSAAAAAAAAAAGGLNTTPPVVALSNRPSRVTISSVGSGAGQAFFGASSASVDGSAAGGPTAATGTAGGAAPISPISPPLHAHFNAVYDDGAPATGASGSAAPRSVSAGGGLPGVVPTWRKIAINQLYGDDEWHVDDLGPVDPLYVGIAGAGAAAGVGGVGIGADGRSSRRATGESDERAEEASRMAAALSIRTMLLQQAMEEMGGLQAGGGRAATGSVGGGALSEGGGGGSGGTANGSALGSRRVSSDASSGASHYPRHSIFRNAVFQPQAEDRDMDPEEERVSEEDEEDLEEAEEEEQSEEGDGGGQEGNVMPALGGLAALGGLGLAGGEDAEQEAREPEEHEQQQQQREEVAAWQQDAAAAAAAAEQEAVDAEEEEEAEAESIGA